MPITLHVNLGLVSRYGKTTMDCLQKNDPKELDPLVRQRTFKMKNLEDLASSSEQFTYAISRSGTHICRGDDRRPPSLANQ
jgi:hypothetical protein